MKRSARRLLWAAVLVLVSSTSGFAQGASQSLSGVVVDTAGGVIPGASVVVVNKATNEKFVGSSRVDLQACKLEYSIVSPK